MPPGWSRPSVSAQHNLDCQPLYMPVAPPLPLPLQCVIELYCIIIIKLKTLIKAKHQHAYSQNIQDCRDREI